MNKLRLRYLYRRYIDNECTVEELQELRLYVDDADFDGDLQIMLEKTWRDLEKEDLKDISQEKADTMYQLIVEQQQHRKSNFKLWFRIAATIIITLSFIIYHYQVNRNKIVEATSSISPQDLMPGGSKAVLTLGNGQKIVLNHLNNGLVVQQKGIQINKVTDGQLVYASSGVNQDGRVDDVQWNTITVPRGGQYNLTLADGTQVFLNSESSLSYPVDFIGNKRLVKLTGEAYFEVAKNPKKTFIVDVKGEQQVEVLGTHFNIEAYTGEPIIKTTLLEGSVKLLYRHKQMLIEPGQMAVYDLSSSALAIENADIDEIMAWKNGVFIFDNENITSIMTRVARWYNIDVVFKGNMKEVNIVGNYSRLKSLDNLLKNIASTGKINYLIEGRRVTIIAQ